MDIPLTDVDIKNALGCNSSNILKYSELTDYNNLDELFKNKPYIVLLIESANASGHWTTLIKKTNDLYYYVNSYGVKPDRDIPILKRGLNEILGNTKDSIHILFENSNDPILEWNKEKMQNETSMVCGRHVIYAIECICDRNMTLKEYIEHMKELKHHYRSYDKAILSETK